MSDHDSPSLGKSADPDRRTFLSSASSLTMLGGLVASYGTFGYMAGRFLYPAGDAPSGWMFVAEAQSLRVGESIPYRAPDGAPVNIARVASSGGLEDFLALSSTCPHLGCQVHWEARNNRFFCPCHNGAFDAGGTATAGPPAEAGQSLPRYELRLEEGLLFINVPLGGLARVFKGPAAERGAV